MILEITLFLGFLLGLWLLGRAKSASAARQGAAAAAGGRTVPNPQLVAAKAQWKARKAGLTKQLAQTHRTLWLLTGHKPIGMKEPEEQGVGVGLSAAEAKELSEVLRVSQLAEWTKDMSVQELEQIEASLDKTRKEFAELRVKARLLAAAASEQATQKECLVCFDENTRDTVFVPCGHLVACMNCAKALAQCPLCRQPVSHCLKVYL
eukprot:TRINITY_DN294_c0_g2_i2.p1 TRINITY_DN294_c0_g2~~TRINITY_DN294_c0_g2_i2.p1  ORF type:complete len:207 (+),score=27.23 TRINITY_DN294_c0_g2_i2:82-702(+)